ncbi:MAG: hypothetical protein ACXVK4_17870 [Acidimicrobiia bacterium]
MTTQLRLLSGGDLPRCLPRTRPVRTTTNTPVLRLDARTRRIGQSGVAEARRRLAEINATNERAQQLVRAS